MKAVLLLAHGTPESLDDMPEYLRRVRGGRPPSEELVAEMRGNYAAIGGRSPLTDITQAQARALSAALDGMPAVTRAPGAMSTHSNDVPAKNSCRLRPATALRTGNLS